MSDLDKAMASLQFSAQGRAVLDHINRLAAENERLRGALEPALHLCWQHGLEDKDNIIQKLRLEIAAKAALGKEE